MFDEVSLSDRILRSMFDPAKTSMYPCKVRHAVSNEKKPIPGFVKRFINRWSCSMRVLRDLTCRDSPASEVCPFLLLDVDCMWQARDRILHMGFPWRCCSTFIHCFSY